MWVQTLKYGLGGTLATFKEVSLGFRTLRLIGMPKRKVTFSQADSPKGEARAKLAHFGAHTRAFFTRLQNLGMSCILHASIEI